MDEEQMAAAVVHDDLFQLWTTGVQLRGLLYWAEQCTLASQSLRAYVPKPQGFQGATPAEVLHRPLWYRDAMYSLAATLFTSRVRGQKQPGAALRALRRLGYLDQADQMEQALKVPATPDGLTLAQVIVVLRDNFVVHTDFRLADQGRQMERLEWGGSAPALMEAWAPMLALVSEVVSLIERELIRRFATLTEAEQKRVAGASNPAALVERSLQRKTRRPSRRSPKVEGDASEPNPSAA